MKTFKELREEAWELATTRWTFRFVVVVVSLIAIMFATMIPLVNFYEANDIQTWGMFAETQMKMKRHSLKTAFSYLGTPSLTEMLEGLSQLMSEEDASISIPVEKINDEWGRIFPMIQSYVKNLRRQNRG